MKSFEYTVPKSIDEAIRLLGRTGTDNRAFAGGTDLLTLMKADISSPDQLIDIKRLPDLPRGIENTGNMVMLGALTTLAEIEQSPLLAERYPLLCEAASLAATPQLRNRATIAGNLLQRPRCWYFRHRHLSCWLKGDDSCPAHNGDNSLHALFGHEHCCAVHPSDLATALLALDAMVQLVGPSGVRTLPLADLYALPQPERRQETILNEDELLLAITLPELPDNTRSVYLKAMDRKTWSFALVGVAALVTTEQNRITRARLALSGVAPIPWRATGFEQILQDKEPDAELFENAADEISVQAQALSQNAYKKSLLRQMICRALGKIT